MSADDKAVHGGCLSASEQRAKRQVDLSNRIGVREDDAVPHACAAGRGREAGGRQTHGTHELTLSVGHSIKSRHPNPCQSWL